MDGHFIKNWLDSLMVLWSFVGAFCPKFSAPHSGKTMHWMLTRFGGAIIVWTSSITTPSLVVVGLRMPPGGGAKKFDGFLFLFIGHAFKWQSLWMSLRHESVSFSILIMLDRGMLAVVLHLTLHVQRWVEPLKNDDKVETWSSAIAERLMRCSVSES